MSPAAFGRRHPRSSPRFPERSRVRSWTAYAMALVLAVLLIGTSTPPVAEAAVQKQFTPVYQSDQNGAISIVGNSQMSCQTSASGCTAARGGSGANLNNNNYVMAFQDTDAVAATTNSTSTQVAVPSGSTILYARLLWGARMTAGSTGVAGSGAPGTAKFRAPNQAAYSTVTATTVTRPGVDTDPYQASLDVTSTVQAGGNGTYWFADQVGATGADRYAGWVLVVAYSNPNLPLRNLTVFEGFADITTENATNSSVSATVSGFITPTNGTVNASVGFAAWEGDLGTTGDVLKLNGTTLSDSTRPANNSFNSSISNLGVPNADRNPSSSNNFGVDMGRTSANGVLGNSATSATVNVSTTGDYIYLGLMTTEIDLYTPSFVGVSKTVTNLNGNSPAKVGDTLEYRLSFTNSGQDTANNVAVRDPLPNNVTYVPNTMTVVSGANASTTPKTDAVGDDVADYVSANRLVRVRLGTGASGTAGGTVLVNAATSVTFRVTLDRASAGTTVTNGSLLDYRALTLGRDYTFTTNTVDTPVQTIADLALAKTSTPTAQTAGSPVTYTLAVTNNGPNAATSVVTTDTLPAGVSYVGATTPSGTSCSASGQTITCTTDTIANGATTSIPISVTVGAGTAAGTLVNRATVTAATADDVSTNNSAVASTAISRSADLRLTKAGPSTVIAGNRATYTLTVTNDGPSSAVDTSLTDALPVGTTLVSTNPSQGTCSPTGQTVICPLGTLAPGATATVVIVATVSASFTDTQIVNSASVTSGTPDPTEANTNATLTTTVTQNADIVTTKTASATPIVAGNTLTYTVNLTNSGQTDARGVSLTDPIPTGLTVLQVTPTQGTCTNGANDVTCAVGLITPGSTARVSILARVSATRAPGPLANTATATTTTAQTNTANDVSTATITVSTSADLSLTKTASPDPVQLGNNLTYTLTAANAGPSQATGTVITDTLPTGTTFVSSPDGCTVSNGVVSCSVGTLAVGASTTRAIVVSTPGAGTTTLTNVAEISATTPDSASANNTARFVSSAESLADLSLAKTTAPSPVVPGRTVVYTLTGRNGGPSSASGVTFTDTLPTGVTYVSATVPGGTCSVSGQTVTCTVATLAGNASVDATITGSVDPDLAVRSTSNTASIAANTPGDPTLSNNTVTSTAEIARSADVGVVMRATTPTVRAGEEATYAVTITNAGPSTARGVVVTGQVPDGLLPVAGSSGGACTVTGRTVSCPAGTLGVGASVTLNFRALVLASTPAGPISGTAFIGATTADPNAANNSSDASLTVTTAADLVAGKAVDVDSLVAGGTATYTLTATNNGPSDATAVTLTDTVPAGLTITSVSPSAGSCTVTGQRVDCATDRLAPGSALTVRVAVTVAADATGTRVNSVTVGSAVTDPTAGNDTASLTTPITQSADLQLSKTVSPDPVTAGSSVRYTFSAVNTGPSVATSVVLTDTFPAGMTPLAGSISAPQGTACTLDAQTRAFRCTLGSLAPGAAQAITVDARVSASTDSGTELTNSATLTSPTATQRPGDRTSSVTSTVRTSADVSVTQSALAESPIAGGTQIYVVTITNNGPSEARRVRLTNVLPNSVTFDSAINPYGECEGDGATGICDVGTLAPGEVAVIRVTVNIDPKAAGQVLRNLVKVTTTTDDPRTDNDSATLEQPVSGQNDLTITKRVTSGAVVAGRTVTYALAVTNDGPSQARNVTLTDVLPDRLGYGSATATADGSCSYDELAQTPADDDQVRCVWGTVDVGDTVTATLTVTVPVDYPTTSSIVNTATAVSSATDPTPASATVTSAVTAQADLSARKTLLSGAPTAGQEVRWQVSVRNAGPSTARTVRLSDLAPTGLTFTTAETSQGTCPVTAGSIVCELGDLAANGSATVTISGQLSADFTADDLTNSALVGSQTPDPDTTNNTGAITTPARSSADLALTKTASSDRVVAGENITWTITATNNGPSLARAVQIDDTLPAGVTLVSRSITGGGTCTNTRALQCSIDTLATGTSAVLTVVGRVSAGFGSSALANTARISSAVADPNPLDNSVTATTTVVRSADLSITQTGDAQVAAGEIVTWQATVRNTGPSDANGLIVIDDVPPGLLGLTGTFPGGSCSPSDENLICPAGIIAAGSSVVITISGRVDPATTLTTLSNTVTASSNVPDPTTDDLTSTFVTRVVQSADLSVTKTAATTGFTAGQTVAWDVTVRNAGPSLARTVQVRDVVPAGVSNVAVDNGGASCQLAGGTLVCDVASVSPGTPQRIQLRGTLDAGYTGADLSNTATVSAATPDPDTATNSASATTPVGASADLSLAKAVTSGPPVAGEPITFVLTVSNAGPSTARTAVVTDSVPTEVRNLVASSPSGTCAVGGQDITCTLPTVAAGATSVVTVTGVVSDDFTGSFSNSAEVAATTADPNTIDNTATADAAVGQSANLSVTKSAPATVVAGTAITWGLTVTNAGPSQARDVRLVDTLPAGVNSITSTSTVGSCTADGVCSLGNLDVGRTITVTFTGTVSPGFVGDSLVNSAVVSSPTADPDSSGNQSRSVTAVTSQADLVVQKSSDTAQLVPGTDSSYTIDVRNVGPSTARLVTVTDTLPDGLSLRADGPTTGSGTCQVTGRVVTCEVDELAPDGRIAITVPVTLDAAYTAATIANTATAASATTESVPASNSDTETNPVQGRADLTLAKTGPTRVTAGTPLAWQLELTNDGPSDARSVVVTDTLPAGLGALDVVSSKGTCTVSGRTISCAIGTLAAGTDVTIDVSVVGGLDPSYQPGDITNAAVVTSSTPDTDNGSDAGSPDGRSTSVTTTVVASADVTVAKVATQATAVAGGPIGWTVTVANTGPSTARDVVVADPAVAGLTDFTLTPPAGVTCADGTCTIGTLLPGAVNAVVIGVTARIPAGSTAASIANTAVAQASTSDPDPGDNRATAPVLTTQSSDLSVVKTGPERVVPGERVTYVLTLANTGPSTARNVVLTDDLPTGLTDVEVAGSGMDCTGDDVVTCRVAALSAGADEALTVRVSGVLDPAFAAVTLDNTATVTATTPDVDVTNNSSTLSSTVQAQSDLSLTKTGPASVTAGRPIAWTLTVANDGPSTARAVVITDTLPAGVTDIAAGAAESGVSCAVTGSELSCAIAAMADGDSAEITLSGVVDPAFAGTALLNDASVTSASTEVDPADNRDSVTTTVATSADLSLTKSVDPDPIEAGTDAVFTLQVANTGPSLARGATVTDVVPTGMTVGAVTTDVGACTVTGQTVSCDLGDLAATGSNPVTITVPVAVADDFDPGEFANTASVLSETQDPDTTDNTGSVSGDTETQADLSVAKTADRTQAVSGERITWTLAVTNDGPSTARAVQLVDSLPDAVTVVSATVPGGTCAPVDAQPLVCSVGDVRDGQTVRATVVAQVDAAASATTLTNAVAVSSATSDPDVSGNSDQLQTPVRGSADLTITKTADPRPAVAGSETTWTVTVTNNGPSLARGLSIVDELPDGVSEVQGVLDVAGRCVLSDDLTCAVDSLAPAQSVVLTVTGDLDADFAGSTLSNVARVSSTTPDPTPADNRTSVDAPVGRTADVSVTQTGPATVTAGQDVTWTVTVTNDGPSDAAGVVLTDVLPAGLLNGSAVIGDGAGPRSCTAGPSGLVCTVGTIPAGQSVTVTVTGRVDPATQVTTLRNTASATATTADPDDADLTTTFDTAVTTSAGLSVTKVATSDAFVAGETIGWTITVTNDGPSVARAVTVSDPIPAGVLDAVATATTGTCALVAGELECSVDALAPGTAMRITLTGTAASDVDSASLANTVSVASATDDPDADDNTVTATTPVERSADLVVGKAITSGPPVAGTPIDFLVRVTNLGPSEATGVVLTDVVPSDVGSVEASTADGTCTVVGRTVRCYLGTLADSGVAEVEISGIVSQRFDGAFTNTATVDSDTPDPSRTNNSGQADATIGESADLSLTKTAAAPSVVAGDQVSWTLQVTNGGPSIARDVTLTDLLPAGLSGVEVDTDAGTCTDDVTCLLGDLDPASVTTVTVTADVSPDYRGRSLANSASVSSPTADANSLNNAASTTSPVERSADLSVQKTVDPSILVPGTDASYTLRVTNEGSSTADQVDLTDTLPAGLSLQGVPTSADATCTTAGAVVTCSVASLAPGADLTVTVPVRVAADLADATLTNTASVVTSTPDADADNDTVSLTSTVTATADLTLTKTGPARVVAGTPLGWQLVVVNDGPSSAADVVVTDQLPEGVGTVDVSTSLGSCTQDGRTVRCAVGSLGPDASVTVTIDTAAPIAADYALGAVTNSATVTSPTADAQAGPDNGRTDSVTTQVEGSADLAVTAAPDRAFVLAGEQASWTVTVTNLGPSTARGVSFANPSPTGLTGVVLTPPAGATCDADTCTVDTLDPGADNALVFTVSGRVPAGSTATSVTNTSSVDAETTDPEDANDTVSSVVEIGSSADVSITKTGPASAVPGEDVSWTITVANAGPSTARDVVVTDAVPTDVTGIEIDAPNGVDCTGTRAITCTVGDLAVGDAGEVVLTLTGALRSDADADSLSNTVEVTASTSDPDASNNASTADSGVGGQADLSVTKTGPRTVTAGSAITWTVAVANDGPSTARDVVLTDTVPDGVTVTAVTQTAGTPADCTVTGPLVSCTVAALADGARSTFTLNGTVAAAYASASLTNSASVDAATPDPQPADNTTPPVSTSVTGSANLSVDLSVDPDTVEAGTPATFTMLVANVGPSVARGTVVSQSVPVGMVVGTVTSSVGTCVVTGDPATGQTVACTLGDVAPTGDDPIVVTVAVDVSSAADPAGFASTASVLSDTTDPDLTDNTDTLAGPTATRADLGVSITTARPTATPGGTVEWTVVVDNDGPSEARGVRTVVQVPAGVTVSSATVAGGTCAPLDARPLVCTLGDVEDGGSRTISVVGTVDPASTAGSLTVSAAVSATGTADPDPTNNSDLVTTPLRASADLVVVADGPATTTAGGEVRFTVRVTNDGPSVARDLVIADTLPAGLTLVSQTLSVPGTCTSNGGISCTVAELAPGAEILLTVLARVPAGYTGASLVNTGSVSAATPDPALRNNSDASATAVSTTADVSVSQVAPASITAGTSGTWTLTVTNDGPSDATGVELVDTLPAGLTGVTATLDGGTCTVSGGVLTCPIGTVGSGTSVVITLTGLLDPASTATTVTNRVEVTSATTDPDTDDLSSTVDTPVTTSADLSITKVAQTTTFGAGDTIGWTLTVRNAGPSVARQVLVTDAVPDGVTGVTATSAGTTCVLDEGLLTCEVTELAPGVPLQISLTGLLAADYDDDGVDNLATVDAATPDPDPSDDTALAQTDVATSADLSLGKAVTSGPPVAGSPITFALTVTNDGPSDATNVVVTDRVPAEVSGLTTTTTAGTCAVNGSDVTCDLDTVADGATVTVSVSGVLASDFDGSLTNSAQVTSSTADPVTDNNIGTADAAVGESADLSLTKTGPVSVSAGEDATWTLVIGNDGPSVATGVELTDLLPAGVTDVRVTGATCTTPNGTVVCGLGTVAVGVDRTVTITARVAADTTVTTLVNTARVDSDTPDPSSTNSRARTETTVGASTDLRVTKAVDPSTLTPGVAATYRILVVNDGPSVATAVSVTDLLPDGVTVSGEGPVLTGPGASAATCATTGRAVGCEVDTLAPGAELELAIPVVVDAGYAGATLVNTASATSATPDADLEDNSDTITSDVTGSADLTLTKTGPTSVVAGTPLSWDLELTNDGPSAAQQVVITDTLPAGLGDVTVTTDRGTCTQDGRSVECLVGTVAAGATVNVTIAVAGGLDPSYDPGSITNSASVTSTTPDSDGGRTDTAVTDVDTSADVRITKTADSPSAVAGGQVAWTITVINDGPSTARDVEVTDAPVAGLDDFTLVPPTGVTCDDDGVCDLGDLLPGAANGVEIGVTATVPAGFDPDRATNTASVSTSTDDPDTSNNSSTAPVDVTRSSDLAITKTGPATAVPGTEITWAITATNNGPSAARDVVVSDAVPDAVTDVSATVAGDGECTVGTSVRCDLGDVPVGTTRTVTLTGTLSPDASAPGSENTLENTARVTSSTFDTDQSDNAATATTEISPAQADVSVTKTGPDSVTAGESVRWVLTATNDGPSTATGVVLTDVVPAGVGAVTATSATGEVCTVTGTTVTCTVGSLADGATARVTIEGTVDADRGAEPLVNTATVTSTSVDGNPANDSATTTAAVAGSTDLAVTKSVTGEVEAGQPATFVLEVSNDGPSVARGVVVTDQLPAGMTVTSVTANAGTCVVTGEAVTGQQVTCAIDEVAVGAEGSVRITIGVDVGANVDAPAYSNTASVLSDTPESDPSDNSSTVSGPEAVNADLSVTKSADRRTAVPGEEITWTLTATNDGPATARDVRLTDLLPAGVTLTSVEGGPAGACPEPVGGVLTCAMGDLAPDETVSVTVQARLATDLDATSLSNAVTIASATTNDPDPTDNTDQVSVAVRGTADLGITKVLDGTAVAGDDASWTVRVTNTGPSTARGIVVTDTLSDDVVSASGPEGCVSIGRTLTCTVGDLAAGASTELVVVTALRPDATGTVTNAVAVTSATDDSDGSDDTASASAPVVRTADLAVTKSVDTAEASLGDLVTYRVSVTNDGPSTSTGVRVVEQWPGDVAYVGAETDAGRYDRDAATWWVGTLAPGQSEELVLTGRVTGSEQLTNQVTVEHSGGVIDDNQGNDVANAGFSFEGTGPGDPGTGPSDPGTGPSEPGTGPTDQGTGPGSGEQPGTGPGKLPLLPNTGGPAAALLVLGWLTASAGAAALAVGRKNRSGASKED